MLENLDLIRRIEKKQGDFSKGQKRLAAYINENYDKAAFLTASKLGKAASVSESTVVRFAYQLEYEGYPQLQKAIQDMVRTKSSSLQRLETAFARIDEKHLLSTIFMEDQMKIKDTMAEYDNNKEFDEAMNTLLKAKNIYILGIRSSAFLADILGYYLNMIFDNVKVIKAAGTTSTFEQIYRVNSEDVMIGISFPRYSRRTVNALEFASKQGTKTITISDSKHSPLNLYGNYNLIAKSEVVAIVDSLVAPLSLINAIVVAICLKKKEEVVERMESLESVWKRYGIYDSTDESKDYGEHNE